MGMVEQLVALLQTPHQSNHEYLMSALLSLVSDHQGALAECRRPELQLKECLKSRRKFLKGKEEYLVMTHYTSLGYDKNNTNKLVLTKLL